MVSPGAGEKPTKAVSFLRVKGRKEVKWLNYIREDKERTAGGLRLQLIEL